MTLRVSQRQDLETGVTVLKIVGALSDPQIGLLKVRTLVFKQRWRNART